MFKKKNMKVIMQANVPMQRDDMKMLEKEYEEKLGCPCVIIESRLDVLRIPPIK